MGGYKDVDKPPCHPMPPVMLWHDTNPMGLSKPPSGINRPETTKKSHVIFQPHGKFSVSGF